MFEFLLVALLGAEPNIAPLELRRFKDPMECNQAASDLTAYLLLEKYTKPEANTSYCEDQRTIKIYSDSSPSDDNDEIDEIFERLALRLIEKHGVNLESWQFDPACSEEFKDPNYKEFLQGDNIKYTCIASLSPKSFLRKKLEDFN